MFSGRVGRPDTIGGNDGTSAVEAKGADPWEQYSGSEDGAGVGVEENKDDQKLPEFKWGKETPGMGNGKLDQILESISALASSVALL